MATNPRTPKMLKGALVAVDPFNPLASVIVFQYNPDTLTRTLQPQGAGEGAARSEAQRLRGAPVETIKLEVELDGTDHMEHDDATVATVGIHPQIAALEMLL